MPSFDGSAAAVGIQKVDEDAGRKKPSRSLTWANSITIYYQPLLRHSTIIRISIWESKTCSRGRAKNQVLVCWIEVDKLFRSSWKLYFFYSIESNSRPIQPEVRKGYVNAYCSISFLPFYCEVYRNLGCVLQKHFISERFINDSRNLR